MAGHGPWRTRLAMAVSLLFYIDIWIVTNGCIMYGMEHEPRMYGVVLYCIVVFIYVGMF